MESNLQLQFSSPNEFILPSSIYDIKLSSADGRKNDILGERKGKVTLLFNVAAGCGNIPQHTILEEINQIYEDCEDFGILAIVVDDFACHGYPEFQNGIQDYIEKNALSCTVGEVAEQYAKNNFNTTYEFSELTNGRHDKHVYDSNYVPGTVKQQEQHELWAYLTGAYMASMGENGIPHNDELVPWSNIKEKHVPSDAIIFTPLTGNFTKFLIDRTGTRIRRYQNGFLLGERGINGDMFPWNKEKYQEDGRRDHNPDHSPEYIWEKKPARTTEASSGWPDIMQRAGMDISISLMRRDIESYLKG